MKKIRITESQLAMLQKIENEKKGKIVKITEEQFKRLFESLDESNLLGHPVAGDGGNEYIPQTEKENEKTTQIFNEGGITMTLIDFAQSVIDFLKVLLTDNSFEGMSPFWKNMGITNGEFMSILMDMGIVGVITVQGMRKYKVYKKNFKKKIIDLYKFFKNFKDTGEPEGPKVNKFKDPNDPRAKAPVQDQEIISLGDDIEIVEAPQAFKFPKSLEKRIEQVNQFIAKSNEHDINAIEPDSTWEEEYKFQPVIVKGPRVIIIHKEVYGKRKDFKERYDIRNEDSLMDLKAALSWVIRSIKKGFRSEGGMELLTNETTVAGAAASGGSSGPFVGPMNASPIKKEIGENEVPKITMFSDEAGIESKKMEDIQEEEEIEETTTTASVGGSYVTPKIWAKDKKSHKNAKKPMYPNGKIVENSEAFTKTSYPEGEFVEFDDCVKPGHSDVAINGGCSTGAVDGVVKTKKSKGSITSEDALYYEVAKRTGRKLSEVKEIITKHKNLSK